MSNLANIKVLPVLTPADTTTTVTEAFTTPVDMGEVTEAEFDLFNGTVTGDTCVIKVYKDANTTTTGGTAVSFYYKLTAATGSDSDGEWTASASTGYTMAADADGKILRIKVSPAQFADYPYCYLGIDPGSSMTTFIHGVTALLVNRFAQSVTASVID